ncbi:MAG: tRNA 2-thiouridine(34) synthase MnmA, partial [Chitinophagia bacterium]|nr:tRNA 2-thiouridine(34) synthase MnmA [Chitinophagia bacterium]
GNFVIENFVEEYLAGRTPNPCVLCNTHIKWSALLKRADALNCNYIATGHYVKVRQHNHRYVISKATDLSKDQSYVLWGLGQDCLSRSIFPLGGMLKTEVRQVAYDMGYKELAKKAESYEICFVPDNDYRGFLKRKIPGLEEQLDGGNFVLADGTIVGKHRGYPFYTVGQRKGLEVTFGKPMFVKQILPDTNTVVLGEAHELQETQMSVKQINWIKYDGLDKDTEVLAKIRYRDAGSIAQLTPVASNEANLVFNTPVTGIAPGQSAVFYEGDDVIGGGIIQRL